MATSKIHLGRALDDTLASAKIADGTILNADVNACAAVAHSKVNPTIASTTDLDKINYNIALLGFKMAVNESLTVFNLIDGVVDEFHDESGADEAEGSNDTYNCSSDYYINSTSPTGGAVAVSGGFTTSAITEPDNATTGANPTHGATTHARFTVPSGLTALNFKLWGAGGGGFGSGETGYGGGGGYAEGTIAVTASQVIGVAVGEGSDNVYETGEGGAGVKGGGGDSSPGGITGCGARGSGGAGASGVYEAAEAPATPGSDIAAPDLFGVAGGGGGSGYIHPQYPSQTVGAGAGGGLTGDAGATTTEQTNNNSGSAGGGGDQEQGGQAGSSVNPPPDGEPGGFLAGGTAASGQDPNAGAGGEGYYGGGGGGSRNPAGPSDARFGGGGSSYYGHPQVTSGSTEEGSGSQGGGVTDPAYVSSTNEGSFSPTRPSTDGSPGEDGYVLLTGCASATTTTTNIVSNAFTASSTPSTARIVVFEENVDTPTLNTDVIASVSRDGGSNFTNVTLADSGYVTGSSGQRILTGIATISGQPSGTNMRWKLALANNSVKIHGVSLSWS